MAWSTDKLVVWFGVGLVVLGLVTIGVGLLFGAVGARGGRLLPGDIVISRPGLTFLFPIQRALC